MKTARSLKRITGVLLGAMLFAQAAFALAGCDWTQHAPAEAIARTNAPPCHQDQGPAKSVCVAHCLVDFQSLDKPAFPLPALYDAPVIFLVRTASSTAVAVPRLATARPIVHPPPRILFQSFLI